MIYKITIGKHRAWPPKIGIWLNKSIIRRRITFHQSSKYDLDGFDQEDTNKLFGIGYFWNHHDDSARFGWRYDKDSFVFIISAYAYVDGQRIIKDICRVMAGRTYLFSIQINPGFYHFTVSQLGNGMELASYSIPYWHKKRWSFPLGFYFGGNRAAPHTITINLSKA